MQPSLIQGHFAMHLIRQGFHMRQHTIRYITYCLVSLPRIFRQDKCRVSFHPTIRTRQHARLSHGSCIRVSHFVHQYFLPQKFCLSVRHFATLAARGIVLFSHRQRDFCALRYLLRGSCLRQDGLPRAVLAGISPVAKVGQAGIWSVTRTSTKLYEIYPFTTTAHRTFSTSCARSPSFVLPVALRGATCLICVTYGPQSQYYPFSSSAEILRGKY